VESDKLRLWRLFIIGRSAVTGAFLVLLGVVNGLAIPRPLYPLFAVASVQFAANGIYLYLWKRRDIAFLGYLCFSLEIALITLLIFFLGRDGNAFVLAFLWPIIMGGWLMGHRAILPLTLMSISSYAALIILHNADIVFLPEVLTPTGISQGMVLSLPYLAFISLLVWALTTEMERGEENLNLRNQDLRRINARLRSLVTAGEQVLSRLSLPQLLASALEQVERITGYRQAAIHVREGDTLRLQHQNGLSEALAEAHATLPLPETWRGDPQDAIMVWQQSVPGVAGDDATEENVASRLIHLALPSPRGIEGMLTLMPSLHEREDHVEEQILQILGHQLGIALENARLFDHLRHERNLLHGILSNMAEGVFVVSDDGRAILSNQAAEQMLGVVEGRSLPAWFATVMAEERGRNGEMGERLLVELEGRVVSLSLADLLGEHVPSSTICVARDITQEAQVEQMKSDFVAYASHELRTPLTTIKMLVRLLLMDAPQDGKAREYLTIINTQLERQTRLIANLLDLARLEAGRYELPMEEVDVPRLMQGVAHICRPLAEEKGLEVSIHCHSEPGPVLTNAGGLEQVLTNLLGNAIKFTDAGGRVALSCQQRDAELHIAVEDTGIGMSAEQLGRIFTKFYTVRNPHKHGEGTGLGLAISNMIMTRLGGRIDVTSEVGVGSCFTARIPAVPPAVTESINPCVAHR
jgi:signal transduction histidine kinase